VVCVYSYLVQKNNKLRLAPKFITGARHRCKHLLWKNRFGNYNGPQSFHRSSQQNTPLPGTYLFFVGLWVELRIEPWRGLWPIQRFALVRAKLLAKAFLRVCGSLKRIERDFEGRSAIGTKANGGCGSDPFGYAKVSLFHSSVSHRLGGLPIPVENKHHFRQAQCLTPHFCYASIPHNFRCKASAAADRETPTSRQVAHALRSQSHEGKPS